ncbi:MAG: efflux transporter outer membrane subunit [Candidatus Omnitrophica bacterium]|nr:efflux transporter outer membrane subunit [Candidatus Omnitrophota bacterium]
MKISELSIKRPILASMMNLTLVLFGLIGLYRLAVRELPDIDPPIINVLTVYPGASAKVVETQVTEPIEDALASVEGIKKMTSENRQQLSSITLEFNLQTDIDIAAQDVRDRISRVRGRLPDDIDEPVVAKQDADARPSLWIALYSNRYSTLELTNIAENMFKDRLQTVPGVSSVIFGGSKRFAIRIWLDSQKMAARNLTVLDVERALKEQSVELPSGSVESLERELSIETRGELKTPNEYNELVIQQDDLNVIKLKDIGFASVGVEDERTIARYNAQPAVGIGVIKQSKANTIEVTRGIKQELDEIRKILPEGITAEIPYDESIYIEKSIKEVWITLALAFFLVVATIYIFLHNIRATLVPAITIPVSVIATYAVMYLLGFSINIITMLAFILAIGLVVDDAIVVLENIHRHMEEGMSAFDASITGMKEIGFAVIATTVALVCVFLPMAFQTSDTGRLFIEFAIVISCSVIISTFVALTLAPMVASRVLNKESLELEKEGILGFFERWIERLRVKYSKYLDWSLRHKAVIIIIAFLSLVVALLFFNNLEREFLPEEDKGRLFCFAIAPEGATSEYTDRMVKKMENILSNTPEVEGFFTAVALSRGGPGKSSEGLSFIRLKKDRKKHVRDIVGGPMGLRNQFFGNIEGALVIPIVPKAIGRGFSQPLQLVLQNQNLESLNEYANSLSQKLNQSGFLINVRSTFQLNKPELQVNINRDRAAALGVSIQDIARTMQILFGGVDVNKVNIDGDEYEVIVQLERESRLSPKDLERLYIRNKNNELIQLTNIIEYNTQGGPSAINHFNRLRSATIEATPVDIPLGTAVSKVEQILKEDLPPGFRYEWDGEAADLSETGNEILFVILLAGIVIYMVLAAQFESLTHPFTIMLTIPLATFGAFGALWLVNLLDQTAQATPWLLNLIGRIPAMNINLFSQIGMVLLFGIVTKNGILLVEFANQQMEKGKNALEAIEEAGKIRFRPILMTAMSTIAGILPIAIGFGAGAESRRPLGVAVVGGILSSTILTLFVIPVVYVLLSKIKKPKIKAAVKSTVCGLLMIILFSGCTLGPSYTRPMVKIPVEWKSIDKNNIWRLAFPQDDLPKGEWWDRFQDQKLTELITLAVEQNQDLKKAMATVEKARSLMGSARSDLFPTLELNTEATRSRTTKNTFTSSSASTKSFTSNLFTFPFDLNYEIDLWGKYRRSIEAQEAHWQGKKAAYQQVMLTLTTDVAINYFTLRELDTEIDILDQTIKLRQYAYDVVKERAEAGVSSELDANRALNVLANAKTDKLELQRRRKEILYTLAVLCGQLVNQFDIEKMPLDSTPVPTIPPGLPSDILERRPDIAEAEREIVIANANIGITKAAFFPSITLSGLGGFKSVEASDLFDWESRVWSLGPGVSFPVFQGGKNKSEYQYALAEYDETVAEYRQTVIRAFAEVETALSNIQSENLKFESQKEVLASARQTAELSISRYKQGLVTFLEVVDSERSRLDAELQSTIIHRRQLIETIKLIKSIGGDWD